MCREESLCSRLKMLPLVRLPVVYTAAFVLLLQLSQAQLLPGVSTFNLGFCSPHLTYAV